MRTIKFRAWDKLNKRFEYFNFKEGFMPMDTSVIWEWEITQFTGITCNGHEWYEGDILENDSDWYEIHWDNDEARWEAVGIKSTGEILALSELLSQETFVQGNIYETPELLK